MTSSDGQRPPALGHDVIEPSDPALPQYALSKQNSSGTDEKKGSVPVEQYGVDAEKQSESVGSLDARPSSERQTRPIVALWQRHWKKVAQLVTFMVFTASVPPPSSSSRSLSLGIRPVPLACGTRS